jgi:starch phosphorylase
MKKRLRGWPIGDPTYECQDDARDAEQLYALLEQDVKTAFYERDTNGVAPAWVARMRSSMLQLTARFSAHRILSQYIEEYYRPAAVAYSRRAADKACLAAEISAWHRKVEQSWPGVAILSRHVTPPAGLAPAPTCEIVVEVELGGLDPKDVLVEVFAENGGSAPFRQPMTVTGRVPHANTAYVFKGEVPAVRPESDYTARVVPNHSEVQIPLARISHQNRF